MDNSRLPNRHRWDAWITFAWLMVALAVIVGVMLIATVGTVRMPETDFLGNITWTEQTNYIVWGAAIGQAVGVSMLAAIFSILNSIYQNSCDTLLAAAGEVSSSGATGLPTSEAIGGNACYQAQGEWVAVTKPEKEAENGAVVYEILSTSPFYRILKPGYSIVKANGMKVESESEVRDASKKGKNNIEFSDQNGKEYSINIHMNPEDFGITFKN